MSKTMSQSNMSQKTLQHLNDEREKYNAKLQNWGEELARKVAEKRKKMALEEEKKTCLQLQNMFHMAMLMGFLPNLNTRTSMMNYLKTRGDPDWDYTYIWSLANTNKIDWVKGYGDPRPYEEYKKAMNNRLAEILRPENVIC